MVGKRLGVYELREEIGRGGMGIVYRAVQSSLARSVAVKVLAPHLAADEEFVTRFLREARAAANLEHPGIVTIYDVGQDGGVYYFAMQLLSGKTLEQLLRENHRLTTDQAITVGIQVADALDYAHQAKIYHRDVKPANILIDGTGRCVLTDFGIAWAASETRLTQAGTSLGSPDYMAPEIVQGRPADGRSDLYSLGVLLFRALTGSPPYSGDTPLAVAYQHINEPVPTVRRLRPEIPQSLAQIVERLMAKRPEERFATGAEAGQQLSRLSGGSMTALAGTREATVSVTQAPSPGLAGQPPPASGRGRRSVAGLGLAVSLVGLALMVGVYLLFGRSSPPSAGNSGAGDAPQPAATSPPVSKVGGETPATAAEDPPLTPTPTPTSPPQLEETPQSISSPVTPAKVAEEHFTITTRPAGAMVILSGRQLADPTPVEVALAPGEMYEVRVELEGYRTSGFQFTLEELTSEQRQKGELHFPLTQDQPPAVLVVRSGYPARLRFAGRTVEVASGSNRLELGPGRYDMEVMAPTVYYVGRHTVELDSAGESILDLPLAVEVTIAAAPSHCKVSIDGRRADFVPFTVSLAVGFHTFEFDWQTLGTRRTMKQQIRSDTRRVFLAASEGS